MSPLHLCRWNIPGLVFWRLEFSLDKNWFGRSNFSHKYSHVRHCKSVKSTNGYWYLKKQNCQCASQQESSSSDTRTILYKSLLYGSSGKFSYCLYAWAPFECLMLFPWTLEHIPSCHFPFSCTAPSSCMAALKQQKKYSLTLLTFKHMTCENIVFFLSAVLCIFKHTFDIYVFLRQ